MPITPRKVNLFLLIRLPAAYICGVRVKSLTRDSCETLVRHRWINQNPFRSVYFAVQAMAAELSTGALVLSQIKESGKNISMLVGANRATYSKKATGLISFVCNDGQAVSKTIRAAIETGQAQSVSLRSVGKNQQGETVCEMEFDWLIKVKAG